MTDGDLAPPPLAPDLSDLLRTSERDVIGALIRDGDIIDGFHASLLSGAFEGRLADDVVWLLVPLSPAMVDVLAVFEADVEDTEDCDPAEESADAEPSLGSFDKMVDQTDAWRGGPGDDTELDEEREIDPAEDGIADLDGLEEQGFRYGRPQSHSFEDMEAQRAAVRKAKRRLAEIIKGGRKCAGRRGGKFPRRPARVERAGA